MLLDEINFYEKGGRTYSSRISISQSGWLTINSVVYKDFELDNYCCCKFGKLKDEDSIAVLFLQKEDENTFSLKPRENEKGVKSLYMLIKGFLNEYKLFPKSSFDKYKIVDSQKIDGDKLLIVLKKEIK